ncbi:helix-turn-helix domain-containing protein [Thauera aromatica]|uniref:helix-turn-helix domain-containing protein n=1 Tax=Thauera aromatica TaxID=59405 RepID=UPI001FFDBEFF|nr:helix-turn-helix domain-containing protein [Thauera aromatica]MCK2095185.1 helix-turn-helix domain-containing protein [Thauera aromatica]
MSLLTQAFLLDRYGPLLTEDQLGELLHMEPGTVRNQRAAGKLAIPFIRRGKTPLYHSQDVAEYLDRIRAMARAA